MKCIKKYWCKKRIKIEERDNPEIIHFVKQCIQDIHDIKPLSQEQIKKMNHLTFDERMSIFTAYNQMTSFYLEWLERQ